MYRIWMDREQNHTKKVKGENNKSKWYNRIYRGGDNFYLVSIDKTI
jgi:hypothetical protein